VTADANDDEISAADGRAQPGDHIRSDTSSVARRQRDWDGEGHAEPVSDRRGGHLPREFHFDHRSCLIHDRLSHCPRLWSTSSPALVIPPTRRTTIGDRSLPVAGARVWNALLSFVTDSSTISAFKRHLKTYLFARFLSWLPHCCVRVALFFDLVQCSRSCSLYETLIIFV